MSVNYPSYFTESLYGIIPASRPFSEGRFYIISIIFNLLWREEWGQHKDPHKAVGARQRGTWQGPPGCVKEWVLHHKGLAAKWHTRKMETHHKNPASLALQSLAKATSVCLSFLYQSLVASGRVGRGRDIWPHKLPRMQSSSAGLQNQGPGIAAAKICPCDKSSSAVYLNSTEVQTNAVSDVDRKTRSQMVPYWEDERAGKWWSQPTHGDVR